MHKLAEFLTWDSLTAQGYFEFEGFTGHLPAKRGARVPGLGADLGRLQLVLLVLHRALHARPRGLAAARRARRRGRARWPPTACARSRCSGQNVNSYGRDLRPRAGFAELLPAVDAIEGIDRIRYTSPHPQGHARGRRPRARRAAARLRAHPPAAAVGLVARSSRRCAAPTTRERYLDRVALIREHVPDCAITTDIIVGFPGETEEDFAQTLEVVEEVGYDGAFTFIFSPRRGTEAADVADEPSRTR